MTDWQNSIHTGDCFDVLDELPAESVHAVVTDPPYGEGDYTGGFMSREWDQFDGARAFQEWNREWATEAKRVLKPGGHLLAFGSDDGHHRAACGIEDAGFDIRDHVVWHHGQGFPKALDVSKSIDKQAGAEREVVGERQTASGERAYPESHDRGDVDPSATPEDRNGTYHYTAPATDAAEKWDGWKTALKPATEFVVLARKPLSEGTVAENVQEWGTGALNVGACRIESGERPQLEETNDLDRPNTYNGDEGGSRATGTTTEGRYPANVVFDAQAAERLDREVGELAGGEFKQHSDVDVDADRHNTDEGYDRPGNTMYAGEQPEGVRAYGDSGGPSRYFYTSKATKAERTLDGHIANAHPTVKPQDLMEWLVRLVTAEGQTVLDPFAGSGTTCKAAKDLGREFIGIEKQAKWADVARVRVGLTPEDPARVRGDDGQQGLEAFADGGGER